MLKFKRNKAITIVSIMMLITILFNNVALASTIDISDVKKSEYSEEYKEWLNLPDEEKEKVIMPNMYDIKIETDNSKYLNSLSNVFRLNKLLGSSALDTRFDLRDEIKENLEIKNQEKTGGCWAFAMVAALETHFAREDKKEGKTATEYDFSERHMVYGSLRKAFLNNAINEKGFTKSQIYGGNVYQAQMYMTNGSGLVSEEEMLFENNENLIDIKEIQGKNVVTTLIDAEILGSPETEEERQALMKDVKKHIKENGGVWSGVHGAQITSDCYNNATGAIYANNATKYGMDHAVLIIGWDDNYSKSNFNEAMQPKNNGAWIIKNSWGSKIEEDLISFKMLMYASYQSTFNGNNIYSYEQIPDELVKSFCEKIYGENKVSISDGKIVIAVGDNGFMYVSYEDVNIMNVLYKIIKAKDYKDYNNIYQYDYLGVVATLFATVDNTETKGYIANVFENKSSNEELTKISISTLDPYSKCRVYVNPNGSSKKYDDLQLVDLKEGEYEDLVVGYNTIEFANPIKLTSSSFVVVVELSIDSVGKFKFPVNMQMSNGWENVEVVSDKSFIGTESQIKKDTWLNISAPNNSQKFNLTIKAFTNDIKEEKVILSSIEIAKAPTKITYNVGENFNKTGMVVNAIYTNGTKKEVTNYEVTNGTNLELDQKTVTISYTEGDITKTTTQAIIVNKPEVTLSKIEVKTAPTKTEYMQNKDELDLTGGIITAVYSDGTTKEIPMTNSEVKVTGYEKTKAGKQIITVTYKEKVATFEVTVKAEVTLSKIEVKTSPTKTEYIQNKEDLDLTGGVIKATYSDGTTKEIPMTNVDKVTGYDKTKTGTQTITVEYKGKTASFEIVVLKEEIKESDKQEPKPEVTLTKIEIKSKPTKIEYTQNKDNLDLTGGVIKATYSDGTTKEIPMTNSEVKVTGYDKTKVGKQTITVTYKEKVVTFEITVKEVTKEELEITLTKIEIKSKPTKIEYTQNKDELDLTGGIITAVYSDETTEDILMTSKEVKVTGYDKEKVGKQTITVTYKEKVATFEIIVKEIEKRKPTLSSFEKAIADITKAKSYIYIKKDKTPYSTITIKLDGIEKGDKNSSREFYYYLSGKKGETDIASSSWTKFDMTLNGEVYSANLEIDTRNVKNASEIAESESLYIYIKEVATLDENSEETINTINVERVAKVEVYLDDKLQSNIGTESDTPKDESKDDTTAKDPIPQTGIRTASIIIISILSIASISYIRYRNIDR